MNGGEGSSPRIPKPPRLTSGFRHQFSRKAISNRVLERLLLVESFFGEPKRRLFSVSFV